MSHNFRKPKPRTQAQRDAARANGAQSHGPATDAGKAVSAMNSVRHGLAASAVVLTTESRPKFLALIESYTREFQPTGPVEEDLVEQMANAKWLERECLAYRKALLDITVERMARGVDAEFEQIDDAARGALAFAKQVNQSKAVELAQRYAVRHAREWARALRLLRGLQAERNLERRRGNVQSVLPNEPESDSTSATSTASEPGPAHTLTLVPSQPPAGQEHPHSDEPPASLKPESSARAAEDAAECPCPDRPNLKE